MYTYVPFNNLSLDGFLRILFMYLKTINIDNFT